MTKQAQENEKAYLSSLTSVYLAMLASVYLLYPGLGGYQEIATQKWETYLILSGTYIVAMGIFKLDLTLARVRGVVSLKREGRPMGPSQRLVIGYLLATSLSTFLSQYWSTAIWGSGRREGLITITLYCISFFLVSRYVRPKRWMLWLFAVTISVNCIVALLQFAGYNPFNLYPDGMDYYDGNMLYSGSFLGMVGNVDILSALLSLAIPAFFAALLRWKDSRRRYLLIVPMALCTFVLLQAFVAGGILGVSGAVLLSVPVLLESKTMRRRARFIVVAAILLLAAGVYCFGEHMGGFFYEASELMHGRWDDRFGSGRLYIWRSVLPLVKERPLFGGGPDTLGLRTTAAFDGYNDALDIMIYSGIDTAHNEYFNIAINQGAVSLLCYLALLLTSAVRWVCQARCSETVAICGSAVLGYCIQAFFGLSSPITTPYLWMALALLNSGENCSPVK